jgi:hypothetical protein
MSVEHEIAKSEWSRFGEQFTAQHRGWLTSAVRRSPRGKEHELWHDAALEAVQIDAPLLSCTARTLESDHGAVVTLTSEAPSRVLALSTDDGGHAGLRVETEDGGTTELRFRVSAAPETVDGLVE